MASSPGWKSRTGLAVMADGRHSGAAPRTVEVEVDVDVTVVVSVDVETGAVMVAVFRTVVVEGVIERQEHAWEILLEAKAAT